MFGSIGGAELVLILVVALLVFGPRKLPSIGRTVGKALSELRSASNDFRAGLEREVELEHVSEVKRELDATQRDVESAVDETRRLGVARQPAAAAPSAPTPAAPAPPDDENAPRD